MRITCWISCLVAIWASIMASAQEPVLNLAESWSLQSSDQIKDNAESISQPGYDAAQWYSTAVPSTVLAALVQNGVYPDPYYGLNLKSIPGYQDRLWLAMPEDSPFRSSWWYRTEFTLPQAFEGNNLTLHLNGINYRANIWLNGTQIANDTHVVGMFRRFEFPINDHVRFRAPNALAVEIFSPGHLDDTNVRTKQLEATTGWDDHNPQPPDLNMGIWEDVYIRATGPAMLKHPYVAATLDGPSLDMAHLTVSAYVMNLEDKPLDATLRGKIEQITFEQAVTLKPHETREVVFTPSQFPQLNIEKPRVWWPNPLGPQELYEVKLSLDLNGTISDSTQTRFGIRDITSYINNEGWRVFKVNGQDILIRGGAWMTADMLLRFSHRRYDALIRCAKEANLNMLRSEGFSIRETDEFYDLCDQYGIMVTQQIFGRSIPREDLAIACVDDMMLRIRNHPSLVHFLGHDETFPTETLDKAYRDLIERHRLNRTYQPHSGAFDVEDRFDTGGTRTGTRELWTYANPKHYYERKDDGAWGFAQSGGIGGIVAPFESVRRFIPEDQRWPLWTDALSFHTVTQGGRFFNTTIQMLNARYGEPQNLEEFCRKAQALNYECARGMFEAYGRNKFSATGITTWKYNAAWPAFMTWHYIDWNLLATGAYYGAKTACRPLHVQYSYDNDSICIVNNWNKPFPALNVTAKVYDSGGTEQYAHTETVDVAANEVVEAFPIEWPKTLTKSHFLKLTLEDPSGQQKDSNFYWLSTVPDVRGQLNDDWQNFYTKPESIADHTDLNALPKAQLDFTTKWKTDGPETIGAVTLKNRSPHVAFFIHLAVHNDANGDEVSPTYWEDNYVSLLPGERRTINGVFATEELAGAKPALRIDGWNLESLRPYRKTP